MIWKIAKKEFLLNLMTFKFAVGTIVCVVLTAVFMPILAKDYQQRLNIYNDNVTRNEAELRKVKVYKNITPTLFRAPVLLSVFSEGLEKRIDDSAKIEFDTIPRIRAAAIRGNPYQGIFPIFDASLIFKIVIGALALLVAYDAVSGEKERGTLKLILSGTTRRFQVLLGKLLAGLMILVIPVTVVFMLGVIILLSFPTVDFSGSEWVRIGLMYLTSLVFTSSMYNLGLLFSCLTKKSAVSLMLGLFLWIVLVVVVPNGSGYFATQLRPLPPAEETEGQIAVLRKDYESEFNRSLPAMPDVIEDDTWDAFGHYYPRRLNKSGLEYFNERYRLQHTLAVKHTEKLWEVEQRYLDDLAAQKNLAATLARVSPISLYESVMSNLAGTDIADFRLFTAHVKNHRNTIIEYVRSKTGDFSAPSLFTTCTKERAEQYEKGAKPDTAEDPPLDLEDFPRFIQKADIVVDLRDAIPDMGLLFFNSVLFFVLSFAAFIKYDVR